MLDHIPLIKPSLDINALIPYLREIKESRILTRGKYNRQFAESLSGYIGATYCHLTTSATTALYVCLKVLNVGIGDEVIVSDFSYPASANVVRETGAIPIFADVSLATFNSTLMHISSLVNEKTKCVIFVDSLGNPSGLHEVVEFCKSRSIHLIEDAACAIGSLSKSRKCGSFADLSCFSFHPRKVLCTGEGGAIVTNNSEYNDRLSILLNHGGIMREASDVCLSFYESGFNFRMTEIQAALGLIELGKINKIIKERTEVAIAYRDILPELGFQEQYIDKDCVTNYQSISYIVPRGVNRNQLILYLRNMNIETSIGTYSLSTQPVYNALTNMQIPNSKFLQDNTITLPCCEPESVPNVTEQISRFLLEASLKRFPC